MLSVAERGPVAPGQSSVALGVVLPVGVADPEGVTLGGGVLDVDAPRVRLGLGTELDVTLGAVVGEAGVRNRGIACTFPAVRITLVRILPSGAIACSVAPAMRVLSEYRLNSSTLVML